MRRLAFGVTLALATGALIAAFATSAQAFPSRTTACSICHSGVDVPVTATLTANDGTTASYNVSAPGATDIAVFNGATKTATITGASGTFSVPVGGTYVVYSVKGPATTDGIGSTSVSPVAPAPTDTTAPNTTSNAAVNYLTNATIILTATDNAGGSGVASTYYRLDGGAQTAGTSVSTTALGPHTLEFWSVDVAGNMETPHKTATFAVTAPVPVPDVTAPSTTSNAATTYVSSASIKLTATDNAGGSGVASTYYLLDTGTQTAGTMVSVTTTGTHTLEFWSVDVAGNIETPHKTATFTVTDPTAVPPVVGKTPSTITIKASAWRTYLRRTFTLSGVLTPGDPGNVYRLYVKRPHSRHWTLLKVGTVAWLGSPHDDGEVTSASTPMGWSTRFRPTRRGMYQFKVVFAGDSDSTASTSRVLSVKVR